METMIGFDDDQIREGEWRVLAKTPDRPFVLGGAPVVTCIRSATGEVVRGFGFARPGVEGVLPLSPTRSLHNLPRVQRSRPSCFRPLTK
jgi:hypothetical protein